jgi:hypothetical protein
MIKDLYGWFRVLLKIVFTISSIGISLLVILLSLRFAFDLKQGKIADTLKLLFSYEHGPINGQDPENPSRIVQLQNVSLSFSMFMFIISAELVIHWNHIRGVYVLGGTGQLLALVTGAASFIRVVYKFLVKWFRKEYGTSCY